MQQSNYFIRVSVFLLCFSISLGYAQEKLKGNYDVLFASGKRTFEANLSDFLANPQLDAGDYFNGYAYMYLQFEDIPTQAQRDRIDATGILLLEYIPHKVYIAAIPEQFNWQLLDDWGVRSVLKITAYDKLDQTVLGPYYEDWADFGDEVEILVQYHKNLSDDVVRPLLIQEGLTVSDKFNSNVYVMGKVAKSSIYDLASLPYVSRLEIGPSPAVPESREGRSLHRSYAINNQFPGGDRYDGTGVSIAINDDGFVGPHIDFTGRTEQSTVAGDLTGTHGDMVAGIAGGAGNIDPSITGMAPGSFMHIRQYSSLLPNTVTLHQNDDVMIFSSSYGNGCNAGYTSLTVQVDREIHDNPSLIQVFSAGNSGGSDCGYGAGSGWGNITGGHKIGKNAIATANVFRDGDLNSSSSRGPASDGRLKPDIAAHGNNQLSTDPNNTYATGGGTSAAAPGITGVLAQLYQAYREFNGGANPNSGLMKAALLNTAQDYGNPGPDFQFGWGIVNAYRALQTLENNTYLSSNISQGAQNLHNITIPAGVQKAKIMLYWMDPEGSTAAAQALVNDLDLTVVNGGTTYLPWVLDPTPNAANLAAPATNGVDSLNNMEQVELNNPAAGTYTVTVDGSVIPQGPQEYFVLYEFIYNEITLMYPLGGEGLIPGEDEMIHWDAHGTTGSFVLEYSTNNGSSWNTIATVAGTERLYEWTIPNVQTGQALVRVSRSGLSDQSTTNFSITNTPANIDVITVCPTSLTVTWDALAGATSYDVFYLGTMYMDSVGTTTGTSLSIPIADPNDDHWVSVRAVGPNGLRSRRAIAVSHTTGLLACAVPNDVQVLAIDDPSGSECSSGGSTAVTVTLQNADTSPLGNFPVSYQVAGGSIVTETFTGTVPANGGITTFTFATPLAVGSGSFDLMAWTSLAGDSFIGNDSASTTFSVKPIISSYPYSENFASGANGWTVEGTNPSWVLGTPSGAVINSAASDANSWVTNLSGTYNNSENSWVIGPCFDFSSLVNPSIQMSIWWDIEFSWDGAVLQSSIDGGATWQNVGALNDPNWYTDNTINGNPGGQQTGWSGTGTAGSGGWVTASNGLTGLAGQSSVFLRVAFGSDGSVADDGFAFDDIVIQDLVAAPDLAIIDFAAPGNIGCGDPTATVALNVENLGTVAISSFTAGFSVNGGAYTTETFNIALAAGATGVATFTATADFSSAGTLDAFVSTSGDSNASNDSASTTVSPSSTVSSYPYVEDFEDGGLLDALWSQGTDEDQDWTVFTGSTSSTNTGPTADHTTGSGYYVYTEDSGEEHSPVDLYTPCFDLSSISSPVMQFWYHSNEANGGTNANELLVQISSGGVWTSVDTIGHVDNNWNQWSMALDSYVGQTIQVRFRSRTDNGDFTHDIAIDDFQLLSGTAADLALTAISSPLSVGCGDPAATVSLDVTNAGATTITTFDASYSVNGGAATTQTFNVTLAPGASTTITFAATADLSGLFSTIDASVTLAGDVNNANDAAIASFTVNLVTTYPYVEDFEDGGVLDAQWSQGVDEDQDWTVDAGGTPSTNTGPPVDHTTGTISGYYVYTEDSGEEHFPVDLYTPCFDLSGIANPEMSFWYHSNAADSTDNPNELLVQILSGGVWITLDSIGHVDNNWNEWSGSLTAYVGQIVQVRFRSRTDNGDFTHDIAIDDFMIEEPQAVDLAAVGFDAPAMSLCESPAEAIIVTILNDGGNAIDFASNNAVITVDVNNGAQSFIEILNTGTLAPGATMNVNFSSTANLSTGGVYTFALGTNLAGDGDPSDDTTSMVVTVRPTIASYPYMEDFATGANGWAADGTNSTWELGTPAGTVINSAASDANSWMTGLATIYNNNEDSWVIGPCFDFSSLISPQISLSIWWESEFSWDGAVLQSSIDGGATWQNVGAVGDPDNWYNDNTIAGNPGGQQEGWSGNAASGSGGWVTAAHDLDGLGGQSSVFLRIAFGSDGSVNGFDGVAFDDILIREAPANDLKASAFVSPSSGACATNAAVVSLEVVNLGASPVSSFVAGYSVDGGAVVNETFNLSLAAGDTAIVTFASTADLSAGGNFDFMGFVALSGDGNITNDTIFGIVFASPIITSFPYVEDFEDGGVLDSLWAQGTDEDQDWDIDAGGTPSTGTGPAVDHTTGTVTGYYAYTEDSSPNEFFPIDLYTPCFDIDGMSNPVMSFWYHSNASDSTENPNELLVQIQMAGIWTTVDSIGHVDDNWNEWSSSLLAFRGNGPIQVRFRSRTDNGDFSHDIAIDDFSIFEPLTNDIGVADVITSGGTICADPSQMVDFVVMNFGANTQSAFDFVVQVTGPIPATYNFSVNDALASGATDTITVGPIDMSVAGTYTVQGTTFLGGDGNPANNSLSANVEASPLATAPVISNAIACDTGEVITLTSSGTGTTYWYDSPMGTTPIATGNTFSPAGVMESMTFYAENSNITTDFVGAADTSIGSSGTYLNFVDGLVFDVLSSSNIVIDSLTCYIGSAGNIFVNVEDSGGNIVGSTIVVIDSAMFTATGGVVRIPVGISVPPGTGYQINADGTTVANILRNNSGAVYPYTDGNGNVSITGAINALAGYYYFFYDWQVSVPGCASERVAVDVYLARDVFEPNDVTPAVLPSFGTNRNAYICDAADVDLFEIVVTADEPNVRISLTGETDAMAVSLMNAGMTTIVSGTNAIDDIVLIANSLAAGTYVIEVQGGTGYVASDGYNLRAQHSDQPFQIRTDIDEDMFNESLSLYPNPNTGSFFVKFTMDASVEMDILVVDMYGKSVLRTNRRTNTGENLIELDLGEVAAGLYFIELMVDGQKFAKRVQVTR